MEATVTSYMDFITAKDRQMEQLRQQIEQQREQIDQLREEKRQMLDDMHKKDMLLLEKGAQLSSMENLLVKAYEILNEQRKMNARHRSSASTDDQEENNGTPKITFDDHEAIYEMIRKNGGSEQVVKEFKSLLEVEMEEAKQSGIVRLPKGMRGGRNCLIPRWKK